MNQTVPVTAPFPFELEIRARLTAAKLRISRAELVRRATKDYLDRLESQSPHAPIAHPTQEVESVTP